MAKFLLATIVFVLVVGALPAFAQDWLTVETSSDGTALYRLGNSSLFGICPSGWTQTCPTYDFAPGLTIISSNAKLLDSTRFVASVDYKIDANPWSQVYSKVSVYDANMRSAVDVPLANFGTCVIVSASVSGIDMTCTSGEFSQSVKAVFINGAWAIKNDASSCPAFNVWTIGIGASGNVGMFNRGTVVGEYWSNGFYPSTQTDAVNSYSQAVAQVSSDGSYVTLTFLKETGLFQVAMWPSFMTVVLGNQQALEISSWPTLYGNTGTGPLIDAFGGSVSGVYMVNVRSKSPSEIAVVFYDQSGVLLGYTTQVYLDTPTFALPC